MDVRRPNARFTDLTGHVKERVVANGAGWAEFRCNGGSVSVWGES
jgi:alpha-amylase